MSQVNPMIEAERSRLQRLEGFLGQDPDNLTLRLDVVDLALSLGEMARSRHRIEEGLTRHRNDPALRFKLGNVLLATGQFDQAYHLFSELIGEGKTEAGIVYNKAYAALSLGRPAEAIEILEGISELDQDRVDRFLWLKARTLYQLQDYEAAQTVVDRFLLAAPGDREGLGLKAQILEDLGNLDGAKEIATAVLIKHPNDVVANLVVGEIAMQMQQPEIAAVHLNKVVKAAPTMGRAWSALGFTAVLEQRTDIAIDLFRKAVEQMPNHLGTWHGLAWSQIMRKDYVGALQSIESAMQVDRTFADNHGTLGVIAFYQGKFDAAEQSARRGIRLNPRSPASLFAQSLLASQKGDKAGGEKLMQKIFEGRKLPDGSSINDAMTKQLALLNSRKTH